MSGRGRKQPQRKSRPHGSQPKARKKPAAARNPSSGETVEISGTTAPSEPDAKRGAGARPANRKPARPQRSAAESYAARSRRRKRNQKIGVIVGALALAGAAVGTIIAGQGGNSTPADTSAEVQAVTPTTPAPGAAPTAAAPTTGSPAPPPAPGSAATASAAGLSMTLTCPEGAGASPRFPHEITAPTPYEVTIDYGDGDIYTDTSSRLGAIFSHTYEQPGTYRVSAVLTDPAGRTAAADCTYTWRQ
ncbi:PKD domain-containing protein [Blastococcus sp. CCUG 61487]|uniref:PKD domain-containing protein n=1 Tax=Blastococcus sp. CCUG 61487 TaxID=1840703 RepID=UPI0010BFDE46|nr:PKD domain-containing protein [Blastococcus sp. CCUG 61487]TKJ28502.1 hypothetical protein A6V29_00230 [Blastococcus sp. CCUG 61487]